MSYALIESRVVHSHLRKHFEMNGVIVRNEKSCDWSWCRIPDEWFVSFLCIWSNDS